MKKKLYVIRGKRIEDQLIKEDTSVNDLEQKTQQFAPGTSKRQNAINTQTIASIELVASAPSGQLEVESIINSDSGNKYQSIIVFSNVDYQKNDTGDNATFVGADGQSHHIMPISLSTQNTKVRCTCLDFRWRFSVQHQSQGTLYGPGPGIYQKKTDKTPNNVDNIPGVCKHLLRLTRELKSNGILGGTGTAPAPKQDLPTDDQQPEQEIQPDDMQPNDQEVPREDIR